VIVPACWTPKPVIDQPEPQTTKTVPAFPLAEFEAGREAMGGPSLADVHQRQWDGLRDDLNHPGRILLQPKPRDHWNQSKVRSLGGIALPPWQRIATRATAKANVHPGAAAEAP
jgi:hypothetical protein